MIASIDLPVMRGWRTSSVAASGLTLRASPVSWKQRRTGGATTRRGSANHVTDGNDERSDAELVAASLGGDDAAFEGLVRRYARAAYLVALAATGGVPADAEDAVQDALIQSHTRLHECHSPERFGAWLLRITRNRAHNVRRHEQLRRGETVRDEGPRSEPAGYQAAMAPPREQSALPHLAAHTGPPRPDALFDQVELRRQLLAALALEPEIRRQVLLLHDLQGWTHREIAEALDISTLMSRYYLSVVRRSMRAKLTPYRSAQEER
jgi:RNA polymerase sigma-70 factor (ECF subfamily)